MAYKIFQQSSGRVFSIFTCLFLFSMLAMAAGDKVQPVDNDIKLFEKAVQLSLQQQWPQAESIYRDLITRNSQWPEPGNNLAVLLLKTDRLDEAKQVLEQAVSSSPSYRITQKNRSQLYNYLATQAYDKALGSEQKVVKPELELIHKIYQPVKIIEKPGPVETAAEKIPVPEEDDISRIKRQLLAWSSAWSQGN